LREHNRCSLLAVVSTERTYGSAGFSFDPGYITAGKPGNEM
jgi:hypothetical protein